MAKFSRKILTLYLFFISTLVFPLICLAEENVFLEKTWSIGDSWTLEVFYHQQNAENGWKGPFYWEYVVEDIISSSDYGEEKFYLINVKEKNEKIKISGRLYYDFKSSCLKKVVIKKTRSNREKKKQVQFENCHPVLTERSLLPFDSPVFPLKNGIRQFKRTENNIGDGLKIIQKMTQQVEKHTTSKNNEASVDEDITLKVTCRYSNTGEVLFEQLWIKEFPWAVYGKNRNMKYRMVIE